MLMRRMAGRSSNGGTTTEAASDVLDVLADGDKERREELRRRMARRAAVGSAIATTTMLRSGGGSGAAMVGADSTEEVRSTMTATTTTTVEDDDDSSCWTVEGPRADTWERRQWSAAVRPGMNPLLRTAVRSLLQRQRQLRQGRRQLERSGATSTGSFGDAEAGDDTAKEQSVEQSAKPPLSPNKKIQVGGRGRGAGADTSASSTGGGVATPSSGSASPTSAAAAVPASGPHKTPVVVHAHGVKAVAVVGGSAVAATAKGATNISAPGNGSPQRSILKRAGGAGPASSSAHSMPSLVADSTDTDMRRLGAASAAISAKQLQQRRMQQLEEEQEAARAAAKSSAKKVNVRSPQHQPAGVHHHQDPLAAAPLEADTTGAAATAALSGVAAVGEGGAATSAGGTAKQQPHDPHAAEAAEDEEMDAALRLVIDSAASGAGLSEAAVRVLREQEQRRIHRNVLVEDIKGDENKGRGVISRKFFQPGELILRTRPDLAVLYSPYERKHCAHCFRPSIEGRTTASASGAWAHMSLASVDCVETCAHCGIYALCHDCGGKLNPTAPGGPAAAPGSAAAYAGNAIPGVPYLWNVHFASCRWLRTLPAETRAEDTDYLRFVLEYCARVQMGDTQLIDHVRLLCALEDIQDAKVKAFATNFSNLLWRQFSPLGLIVPASSMRDLILKVKCNALGFPFSREQTLGWAVHGAVCMVNHSCMPNSAVTQSPLGELELRAVRPIAPSDEVTISYIHVPDFKGNPLGRRRTLLEQYRFLCRCPLCEGTAGANVATAASAAAAVNKGQAAAAAAAAATATAATAPASRAGGKGGRR
jgi:hypothetical protein